MSVATVRSLIADSILYDRAAVLGDGVSLEFQLPNYPVFPDSQSVVLDGAPQTEVTDYTMDDGVGVVTFLSVPADGSSVTVTYKYSILTDSQIQSFLDLEEDDIKLAAADALNSIAANQALVLKVMRVLDIQTDGAKVAESLRQLAKQYRAEVMESAEFDYAEQISNTPGLVEKVLKDWLREGT